ncbi:SGNH/GDSL hydrolase family protein [Planctomicrobium sp. SH668]|uniref:SGNH/GDSL hydrolase family protein n=1 Tax=Planctomicrobium sp. SH668 TaxID=3448126 RepID=UPI003F5C5147
MIRNSLAMTCFLLFWGQSVGLPASESEPAIVRVIGDWQVQVEVPATKTHSKIVQDLTIPKPELVTVVDEPLGVLPVYSLDQPFWGRGVRLEKIKAEALTAPDLLVPESVVIRTTAGDDSTNMERGKDFDFEQRWGGLGRIETGRIGADQPVFASYQCAQQQLNSIVLTADGQIQYRSGIPVATLATPPELAAGERRLANVWFSVQPEKLTDKLIFPLLEEAYPEPVAASPTQIEKFAPKTIAKIRSGEPVKILAWGDSVTEGLYLANPATEHWQQQFVARLRERFPDAKIELVTEAWGGRTTGAYFAVPPGELHNYQETVLDVKPDLIISEFVNDAYLSPEQVETRYSRILDDFNKIGAEWVILTPHYVRPDWMGLDGEKNVDDDPRPYVHGLREFSKKHDVALADAALRYGRMWRQGIPHNSLMHNCINHPSPAGLKLFADALMEIFPEK